MKMYNKTRKISGGSCDQGACLIHKGGANNCRIGVMNPTWGGRKTIGGGCGCGVIQQMMELPKGIKLGELTSNLMKGGSSCTSCGASTLPHLASSELLRGGACPCQAVAPLPIALGGYKPTKRNLKYLRKWKKGESIGFTMRSSLKSKGLIPRANGTKRVSAKYRK